DQQLKTEINALRQSWAASGYKTRFFVALVADDAGATHEDLADRLSGIRRATALDAKACFFIPPRATSAHINTRLDGVMYAVASAVGDYLRELTKHARRKRGRAAIPAPSAPPTSGTSQILTARGWNIRYDFKMGVFAEARGEMDAACRCYEAAYDGLFSDEVLGVIPGWSARFDEARMLADVLALRIIRCLLWLGQHGVAGRAWSAHLLAIRDLVTRRGKGVRTYGFQAWEQRWSLCMAELVRRAEVFRGAAGRSALHALRAVQQLGQQGLGQGQGQAHGAPEQYVRYQHAYQPWTDLLFHPGYWLRRAVRHAQRRRQLAMNIPTEDRTPQDHAHQHQARPAHMAMYDTYLVGPPSEEYPLSSGDGSALHAREIAALCRQAIAEFRQRGQTRMVEQLTLDLAQELVRAGEVQAALDALRPLSGRLSFRKNGWWDLMARFASTLKECAHSCGDAETMLRVDWELLNRTLHTATTALSLPSPTVADTRQTCITTPSLLPALESTSDAADVGSTPSKPAVMMHAADAVSCLSASLLFGRSETHVGEPLPMYLVMASCAAPRTPPLTLSEVKLVFEGGLRPIRLQHAGVSDTLDDGDSSQESAASDGTCDIVHVPLDEVATTAASSPAVPSAAFRSATPASPSSYHSSHNHMKSMVGKTDLRLSPGCLRIYVLKPVPREASDARPNSISLILDNAAFNVDFVVMAQLSHNLLSDLRWSRLAMSASAAQRDARQEERQLTTLSPSLLFSLCNKTPSPVRILPRPPKVRLTTPSLRRHYYTDEHIEIPVHVANGEDEVIDLTLEFKLLHSTVESTIAACWSAGPATTPDTLSVGNEGGSSPDDTHASSDAISAADDAQSCRHSVGAVQPQGSRQLAILLTNTFAAAVHELEIGAFYTLASDPETIVFTTCTFELKLTRPFEANYELLPCLDAQPWPSDGGVSELCRQQMLSDNGSAKKDPGAALQITPPLVNGGLRQRWNLVVKMVSFARESLVVDSVAAALVKPVEGCACALGAERIVQGPYLNEMSPEELRVSEFDVLLQRRAMDDQRTTNLALALDIRWHRRQPDASSSDTFAPPPAPAPGVTAQTQDDPLGALESGTATAPVSASASPPAATIATTTTTLAMPRFVIPLGEPRVLATARQSSSTPSLLHLSYTFENPSMHHLTFSLTMEPSEQFLLAGPRRRGLSVRPQSREFVTYDLHARTRGGEGVWIRPETVVVDEGFQKVLNVLAADRERMRIDKNGILVNGLHLSWSWWLNSATGISRVEPSCPHRTKKHQDASARCEKRRQLPASIGASCSNGWSSGASVGCPKGAATGRLVDDKPRRPACRPGTIDSIRSCARAANPQDQNPPAAPPGTPGSRLGKFRSAAQQRNTRYLNTAM
ncbi:hypothetical protein KEM52_005616, partial [Ascosphaera acerosa]